jgi:hypothetical protein
MFSPGRLLTVGIIGLLVYTGFFAVPGNQPGPAEFDPALVAQHEVAAWQAAEGREEMATCVNCVLYQRELHRLSWYRAAESGMALSRAISQFPHMTSRFERVMPQLEEVALIEREWKGAEFDTTAVARYQMNWMIMARSPQQGSNAQRAVTEMADDLGLRYGIQAAYMGPAAADRTEAFKLIFARSGEPDWTAVTDLLTRSYSTLKTTLTRAADASSRF